VINRRVFPVGDCQEVVRDFNGFCGTCLAFYVLQRKHFPVEPVSLCSGL